jgi:hypothetical protein
MLSAVIDRLTGLTSKYFVIGAFVPVLVVGFLNGVLLYNQSEWFRAWARPQVWGAARVFDLVSMLVGLAVAAYVVWSLNGFLRQVLEGAFLRDSDFTRWLRKLELERFRRMRTTYFDARDTVAGISSARTGWRQTLSAQAQRGLRTMVGGVEADNPRNAYDGEAGDAATALRALRNHQRLAEAIPLAELVNAIDKLGAELATNNVSLNPGRNPLGRDWRELLVLIDYAEDEATAREVALANELQSRFGGGTFTAPTAFGNVALSMQSYSLSRYRLNLATFWSRLQPVLQKDKDFFAALQDAKVQLDFLVAMVWLAGLTTVAWVAILGYEQRSALLFLTVGWMGPLATWACYTAAVENYVAFGEIVRTAVDLYRFKLLDELGVARPGGLRDERALWEALQRVTSYGQEWVDLSYAPARERKT